MKRNFIKALACAHLILICIPAFGSKDRAPPKVSCSTPIITIGRNPFENQRHPFEAMSLDNDFRVARNFEDYDSLTGYKLSLYIAHTLQKANHLSWIDWGAGIALAQREFRAATKAAYPSGSIKLTAVSHSRPVIGDKSLNAFGKALSKKEYQDFDASIERGDVDYQLLNLNFDFENQMEKFDIATDIYGPFSYAIDLSRALFNQLRFLKTNGHLLIYTNTYNTSVTNEEGDHLGLEGFLRLIRGIQIEKFGVFEIRIKRIRGPLVIPILKQTLFGDSDRPPTRGYEIDNGTLYGE